MLDSLLAPLGLPSRVVRDLDAVGDAARGMPEFERALVERLDDIGAALIDVRAELRGSIARVSEEIARLDEKVAAMQLDVPELKREVAATKHHVADLKEQVGLAVDRLPDPNSRGPLARARDAIAGGDDGE